MFSFFPNNKCCKEDSYLRVQYIISCTDNGNTSLHYWFLIPWWKFCRNWINPIGPQIKKFSKMFSAHWRWSRLFYGFICLHSAFRKMLYNSKCEPTVRRAVRVDWLVCGVIDVSWKSLGRWKWAGTKEGTLCSVWCLSVYGCLTRSI